MSRNLKIPDDVYNSYAYFTPCAKYRHFLTRLWNKKFIEDMNCVMFIGLNPSTANSVYDDPTIMRCCNFARSWGYDGMYMCNLFSFISTDPDQLILDKINNDNYLRMCEGLSKKVVFVWGGFKKYKSRMEQVIDMFPMAYCLGKTKLGFPKHPLYLKSELTPIRFTNV